MARIRRVSEEEGRRRNNHEKTAMMGARQREDAGRPPSESDRLRTFPDA
jgi:hypothetical protein